MIDTEAFKQSIELLMRVDLFRVFNHIRSQVQPLFVAILNDVCQDFSCIDVLRLDIDGELGPWDLLVDRSSREAIELVIIEAPLVRMVMTTARMRRINDQRRVDAIIIFSGVEAHTPRAAQILIVKGFLLEKANDDGLGDQAD